MFHQPLPQALRKAAQTKLAEPRRPGPGAGNARAWETQFAEAGIGEVFVRANPEPGQGVKYERAGFHVLP